MKKANVLLLFIFSIFLMSCNSLKRGVDGNTYVSTAKPTFSVTVSNLPLRTAGRLNASITTSNALGGVKTDAWVAVYGGESIEQPMAIISQASLDFPYYFDYDLTKLGSINHDDVPMGNFKFKASTYLIKNFNRDAFAPLLADFSSLNNKDQKTYWIVRRFATRTDFNKGKITFEYREKAPENFEDIKALPFGAQAFLEGFEERAQEVFVFNSSSPSLNDTKQTYSKGIATRYLDKNFFGTVSYHEPYN